MIQLSLILFAIAAVGGLAMAVMHIRGFSPPKPVLAGLHGLFAASGLVVLLLALIETGFGGKAGVALGNGDIPHFVVTIRSWSGPSRNESIVTAK